MKPNILVVDDEPDLEDLVTQKFRRQFRDGAIAFGFARDSVEAFERNRSLARPMRHATRCTARPGRAGRDRAFQVLRVTQFSQVARGRAKARELKLERGLANQNSCQYVRGH